MVVMVVATASARVRNACFQSGRGLAVTVVVSWWAAARVARSCGPVSVAAWRASWARWRCDALQ